MLTLEHVRSGYAGREVVHDVSFSLDAGQILCLLGANGSGKTTLFKTILRLLPLSGGSVAIDGRDLARLSRRELARLVSFVPQSHTPFFSFTVYDVVLMARTSYLNGAATPREQDYACVESAIELLNLQSLAARRYTELSGGERQLVLIARAVAQQARLMVLDEPASNLDFGNRALILNRVKRLAKLGHTILMTTHSPNDAFACATRVAVLKAGRLLACGAPEDVLTEACLQDAYAMKVRVLRDAAMGSICLPRVESCEDASASA